jgi:hypothetical protein
MPTYIWFNLLLFSNGHWVYVDSYETLEICQEERAELEKTEPGNYYCFPANVKKTENIHEAFSI